MPKLFTTAIEELTDVDVSSLIGWPESLTVEYKEQLPTREGRSDSWVRGGNVENYAKDKIFKEVVALANTSGGHVILGVEETGDKPPSAARITPIPRCDELAERLLQMAQAIDPPIPLLLARGVRTVGDAGVVVFRVPASRAAPHRSTDKDCYIRRGTNSVAMSMNEIRSLVMSSSQNEDRLDARFVDARQKFKAWLVSPFNDPSARGQQYPKVVGFGITAIPSGVELRLSRLFRRIPDLISRRDITILMQGSQFKVHAPQLPGRDRAIVRGVRYVHQEDDNRSIFEVFENGQINAAFRSSPSNGRPCELSISWITGYLITVLKSIQALRDDAGLPDLEYAIECSLDTHPKAHLGLHGFKNTFNDELGQISDALPVIFPRLSFGPKSETNCLLTQFATDFYDAAGVYRQEPVQLYVIS